MNNRRYKRRFFWFALVILTIGKSFGQVPQLIEKELYSAVAAMHLNTQFL
jgi:hypothetical protein